MTGWLTGMLAIASVFMCLGLWPLIREEMRRNDTPWYRNKALRLSGALWIHGLGALLLFGSALFTNVEERVGVAIWLIWAAFATWLVAKVMIVSVSGWFKTCVALFAVWTLGSALWAVCGETWWRWSW